MKNVLVTGGNGFLGRHICRLAKNKGYNVFAPSSSEFNLETFSGVNEFFVKLQEQNQKIDTLIHSAAYYGGIGINLAEPARIFHRNSLMGINVFKIAADYGVKKVLPVGSACSYPGHITGDLNENDFWNGELHSTVEAYGFSKKIQLVAQKAYYKQYSIESNHLVLTNLYGPHDVFTEYRSHVLSALIKKFSDAVIDKDTVVTLWGDGSPIREFLYVEDAAEAIVRAVELPHDASPINIGTGIGTTIKELAEMVQEYTGFTGEIFWDTTKPNGAERKVLNIKKMKQKLGFIPNVKLGAGLKATVEWYLQNKEEADSRE